ncbi:MAG: hypothetical protein KAS15_03190 [Nanoarchaeota archaeon]|nr:hypothetical protein [Nanoarchaeota archaeon]MCK5629224.1 hypothetical protein [Nanoarchaeota archaeon]
MTQTIDERVQARLDSWAIKYDVQREQHKKYSEILASSMITLYSDVPRGEKPTWMDKSGFEEDDSFTMTLNFAEDAYRNMHETHESCEIIKKTVQNIDSSIEDINQIYVNLMSLASQLEKDFINGKESLSRYQGSKYNK